VSACPRKPAALACVLRLLAPRPVIHFVCRSTAASVLYRGDSLRLQQNTYKYKSLKILHPSLCYNAPGCWQFPVLQPAVRPSDGVPPCCPARMCSWTTTASPPPPSPYATCLTPTPSAPPSAPPPGPSGGGRVHPAGAWGRVFLPMAAQGSAFSVWTAPRAQFLWGSPAVRPRFGCAAVAVECFLQHVFLSDGVKGRAQCSVRTPARARSLWAPPEHLLSTQY